MAKLPDSERPLTVVRLDVDSFKRLRAAHVTPSAQGLVLVRGRNAQGKSALLESMMAALGGSRATPELPITEGAHGAEVVVDLGELVVRRRWTRDAVGVAKGVLTVEGADGSRLASPQAVLDNLVGRFADPVAFLEQPPDSQVRTVLAVLGLDRQLDALEEKAKGQYERRRDLGRDADRLSKSEAQLTAEVAALPPPPSVGESVENLATELQAAKDYNAHLSSLRSQKNDLELRGQNLAVQIERLRVELARLDAEKVRAAEAWKYVTSELRGKEPVSLEPIMQAIREHEAAAKHNGKRDLLRSTQAAAAEARGLHQESEAALNATRAEIATLLGQARFPVPGMAYDPDSKSLTVNGIPFSQASQAEKIKIAAAVAMAGNPSIRVLFARDGSMLDDESRAQLAALAEERGFQLWLEVVDSNREGIGIWIEDGEAYSQPVSSDLL